MQFIVSFLPNGKIHHGALFNPIALRKAKIVYNFGLSECNRVKLYRYSRGEKQLCLCIFASLLKVYGPPFFASHFYKGEQLS